MGTPSTTRNGFLEAIASTKTNAIGLPFIRGKWFFVDPLSGSSSNDGLTVDTAMDNISTAYTACTDGAGDGIALLSRVVSGTTTSSLLTAAITWSKSGITVIGVSAQTGYNGRARVANATALTDAPALITVSGMNNHFENIYLINEGTDNAAIGCLVVSANRNSFYNCHFSQNGGTRTPQATDNDVTLYSSECTFERCFFGHNNRLRSGAANGNLVLGNSTTQIGQNYFTECYFLSYSATSTHGAIKIANAATLGGWVIFDRCKFLNWNSGAQTALTTIIIGETPNNCGILLDRCASVGYAAVGANNDTWFTTAAASAAGTGTIANTIA
jgi:hypothetical protein